MCTCRTGRLDVDGGQQEEVEDDCRFLAGVTGWVAALLLRQGTQEEEQMAWGGGEQRQGVRFGACRILRF